MKRYEDILLVSDWDRTVTAPDRSIPQANTEAVLRFIEEGGRIAIATGHGRMSHGSRWNSLPTNAPAIVFNGAEIYDYVTRTSIWNADLPAHTPEILAELIRRYPRLHYEIQRPDETYVFGEDMGLAEIMRRMGVPIREAPIEAVPRPWVQLAVSDSPRRPEKSRELDLYQQADEEIDRVFRDILRFFTVEHSGFAASRSLPFLVEVQPQGCSKGETARRLAELLGRKTLVCCGDAPNDLSMLQAADLAFVAGDGSAELLNMGFTRAAASSEGVLADVIRRL